MPKLRKTIVLSFFVFFLFSFTLNSQDTQSDNQSRDEIIEFLQKFQAGYSSRDVSTIDEWVDDLMTEDVYIMGTNAVYPNTGEWQVGSDKAAELFSNDWKRWGVLEADIEHADIKILNKNVALIAMTATVTKSIKNGFGRSNEENIERCLKRLADLEKNESKSTSLKLFTAIWDAGMVLKHTELGETFIWPIRISMVLVKKEGKWKMTQTHYSYPISGYPPIRIVDGEVVDY